MRRRIAAILLLLAFTAAGTRACLDARTLANAYAGVSVRMTDAAVTAKRLRDILPAEAEDGMTLAAAWSAGRCLTAEAPSLKTAAQLRVVAVYGDMRQTEPFTLLSGSLPADGDWDGCLLDAASAQTLFHSIDPIGAELTVDGHAYTVRGVAATYAPTLFVRNENAAYENLEFAVRDVSTGAADLSTYLYKHALTGEYVTVQNGLYARILQGLSWLPLALLLGMAAVGTLCSALPLSGGRWRCRLPRLLAALALAAVCVLLLWQTFYWPQSFLPTKAADFAFWGTLADGWKTAWKTITLLPPLPGDILFFRGMRAGLCETVLTAVLAVCLYGQTRRIRRDGRAQLL